MLLTLDKTHLVRDAKLKLTEKTCQKGFCTHVDWTVKVMDENVFHGVLELKVKMPEHFQKPWIMIPGYLYGACDNSETSTTCPKDYPVWDPSLETPCDMKSSWWITPADRTSSPLVYLHEGNRCFAFAGKPHYSTRGKVFSDDTEPQIGIGFRPIAGERSIIVTIPACEEPFTHSNIPNDKATINRITMSPGSIITGQVMVYEHDGDRHSYQQVIEHYYLEMSREHGAAELPEIKSLVNDTIYGITEGHYHSQGNYFVYSRSYDPLPEQIANSKGCSLEWHQMMVGYTSGFLVCNALLKGSVMSGNARAREIALKVSGKICSH